MAHPKTLEAYQKSGVDFKEYQLWHEKGQEIVTRQRKEQLKNDKNQVVKVNSVYRKRVDDDNGNPSEVILWDQTTTGKTGLGNPVSYHENASEICFWYEPTASTESFFNPETEQVETRTKVSDFSQIKKHYLYPFTKENIDMIKKITANNRNKCNWIVEDDATGRSRSVNTFDDWSTKTFNELMYPKRLFVRRLADTDPTLSEEQPQYH